MAVPFDVLSANHSSQVVHGNNDSLSIVLDHQAVSDDRRRDAAMLDFLTKREASYPVNQCPLQAPSAPASFTQFKGSECLTKTFAGTYTISCDYPVWRGPPHGVGLFWYQGACRPHEICIDRIYDQGITWFTGVYSTAWCVAGTSFVSLARTVIGNANRRVTIVPQKRKGKNASIGVVLTREDDNDVLFKAYMMTLIARDAEHRRLGQTISCSNCSNLSFRKWPIGTVDFGLDVVVPNTSDIANVHVFGWP
ncbi:hypothetical protein EV356DRAFT_496632, partial [Viridothelium virens]